MMSVLVLICVLAVVAIGFGWLKSGSASGRCSRCGRFSKRLIPNEDARKTLQLCRMCNAELEIERSLRVSENGD